VRGIRPTRAARRLSGALFFRPFLLGDAKEMDKNRVKGVEHPLKLLHDPCETGLQRQQPLPTSLVYGQTEFKRQQERSLQSDAFNVQQEVAI